MSRPYISAALRQKIAQTAHYRCGYCHTQESVIGLPLQLEHLIPLALGGDSSESNLWLACLLCNEFKGIQVRAIDPFTQTISPLFNPRTQFWADHFTWANNGVEIVGLTTIGRATVQALKLNLPIRCLARQRWVEVGWHPPKD